MNPSVAAISVKGRIVTVPATVINGHKIITKGKWLRIAEIYDEEWNCEHVEDPDKIAERLRSGPLKADIFTFAQKLPNITPAYGYSYVLDNWAAIRLSTYSDWLEGLPQSTRRNIRISEKRSVQIKVVEFDDALVQGIKRIYDESPVRQGRQFWHYGKDLEVVRRENSSYLDRATFIGAFVEDELIGFLKVVYVGTVGSVMQILSLGRHADKKPMNALIAKAVEISAQRSMSHFVYCQYIYGRNVDSSLTEFKRRNGFEQVFIPRYYVPITKKGALGVKLKAHLGLRRLLPEPIDAALRRARSYALSLGRGAAATSL